MPPTSTKPFGLHCTRRRRAAALWCGWVDQCQAWVDLPLMLTPTGVFLSCMCFFQWACATIKRKREKWNQGSEKRRFHAPRAEEEKRVCWQHESKRFTRIGTCCVSAKAMVKCCDMLKIQTVLSMFWFILTKRCLSWETTTAPLLLFIRRPNTDPSLLWHLDPRQHQNSSPTYLVCFFLVLEHICV